MIDFQTVALFIIVVLISSSLIVFYMSSKLSKLKEDLKAGEDSVLVEWLKDMKTSVDKNSDTLDKQLKDQRSTLEEQLKNQRQAMNEQTKLIWERLDNASDVIRTVQKQIGGIQEFGNDIKDLSNILKSPKLRGGLGEQFLYEIMANLLPTDLYKTQYKFRDGNTCDAVVFVDKGIIPIRLQVPYGKL